MSKDLELEQKILELAKTSSHETVRDLVDQAHRELEVTRDVVLEHIIELQEKGKLAYYKPPESVPDGLKGYLFSSHAVWFWVIIILSVATTITIYTIPERMYPYLFLRYILGSIFVLFLPGYSLVKALFPTKEIDNIERTALSMGMSFAMVPFVGLLLNYTPWGIRLTPITVSLLTLTTILTIAGLLREYQGKILNN